METPTSKWKVNIPLSTPNKTQEKNPSPPPPKKTREGPFTP